MTSTVGTEQAWNELTLSEAEYRRASARYRQRRSLRAYLFVLPYFIPFVAFLLIPAFWSVWLSFNRGGILDSAKYVGLANWRAIASDTELTGAIKNVFAAGQFDYVDVSCALSKTTPVKATLVIRVVEHPILDATDVIGTSAISGTTIKEMT